MADTITVKFKVMEDGSLKAIGKDADKASAALDKTAKSARTADRNLKGTAQMTSNTTKSFSKMSQGITGGLVPAYATLAANVFALSAAFNFFKRAADVKILEEGQISYAKNTGLALQTITAGLREASGGMLGFREAAEAAAIGVAKGFSPQQLEDLAEGARKASAALGRNFEDSFDRLIRGASKAEPELLDELGITLRLETATKKYGEAIGKSAKELTAFERSQAVLIETQRQLNDMYGSMEGTTNPFVELSKTFDDIVKSGTNFIMPFFEGLANIINRSAVAAIAVFGALGLSIVKAMIPVEGIKEKFDEFQEASANAVEKAKRRQEAYNKILDRTKQKLEAAKKQSIQSAAKGMGATDSKLLQKAQAGTLTDPKQIGQLKSALKRAEGALDQHGKVAKGIFKGIAVEQVRSLRTALSRSDKHQMSWFKTQKTRWKQLTLSVKVHYSKVKAIGTRTFAALGRAAGRMGKAMNTAMKAAGFIGLFMMIWEIGQEIMKAPFNILMGIVNGTQKAVNFLLSILQTPLVAMGKAVDFVRNKLAEFGNTFINAYNKLADSGLGDRLGLEKMKLFDTATTGAADSMKKLTSEGVDFATTIENSGMMQSIKAFQEHRIELAEQEEAYNRLKEAIKGVGDELDNIASGLAEQTGAKRETSAATALATLGVSGKMKQALAIEDPAKRANAVKLLKKELEGIGNVSPAALTALNNMDLEAMRNLETSAQGATGGLAAMKDAINNINSSLASGDLLEAEFALKALKGTTEGTSDAFKALFGADSQAATKALKDFDEAFSGPTMTSGEFLENLIALRAAQEALALSMAKASMVGGTFAETFGLQNDLAKAALDVEAKRLELEKETDAVKKERLRTELALLNIELQKAGIAVKEDTMGSQMGAALKTGALAGEGAQAQLSPMLGELAKLGPEGELIQSVVNGAFAIQDAFSNAFAVISEKGLMSGEGIQAGLEVAATAMNAIGGIMKQASQAQIAEIDQQIAAEKRRDGKSKESVAKIAALEKKKEQAKRKAFEQDKKVQMAQVVMATASAVMQSYKNGGGYPTGIPMAIAMGAIGAAQLAIISGMSYQGGGAGASAASTPSQINVGSRNASVDLAKGQNAAGELAYARGEQGTGSGMTNFRPAFSGYKNRAAGGFVVGEQGPELFMPEVPGEIIPAGRTPAGQTNVNFSINTVDATGVEELLMNQRGNIIGMIREAANEHGEMFLEGVQEKAY